MSGNSKDFYVLYQFPTLKNSKTEQKVKGTTANKSSFAVEIESKSLNYWKELKVMFTLITIAVITCTYVCSPNMSTWLRWQQKILKANPSETLFHINHYCPYQSLINNLIAIYDLHPWLFIEVWQVACILLHVLNICSVSLLYDCGRQSILFYNVPKC